MAFGYGITNGNSIKQKGAQRTRNGNAAAGTARDYKLDTSSSTIGATPKDQVSLSPEATAGEATPSSLNLDWAKGFANDVANGAGKLVSEGEATIRQQSLNERISARNR